MSKRTGNQDEFLSTMTFAFGAGCDCDECDGICEAPVVPQTIKDAIAEHKKRKLLETRPSQERNLVARDGGLSIWRVVMPPGSDPFIEYGNSHRFLYFKQVPKGREIKAIGEGVVGSKTEQESRQRVSWEEGQATFLKANGGKVVGWVNNEKEDDKLLNADDVSQNVIFYSLKTTKDYLKDAVVDDSDAWNSKLLSLFKRILDTDKKMDSEVISILKDIVNEQDQ